MLSTQYPRPSCDPCKLATVNEQRKQLIADLYKIAYEGITTERFRPQPRDAVLLVSIQEGMFRVVLKLFRSLP